MAAKGFGSGSRLYQQRAIAALPLLVSHAGAWHTVNYGDFARELGMPNPRNLNHVLGAVGRELDALGKNWGEAIPAINCLVVNKHNQTPSRGIQFHMPVAEFKKLPRQIQKQELQRLHRDIYLYPKWNKVLESFGMAPVSSSIGKQIDTLMRKAGYGGSGSETEEHRNLKEYIAQRPASLSVKRITSVHTEYQFASGDKIDVLFKCSLEWVGVEVKGINSPPEDILRGIYQCIKYAALIEATQKQEGQPISGRVILALGGELPPILEHPVNLLEIDVRRNIAVQLKAQTKGAAAS